MDCHSDITTCKELVTLLQNEAVSVTELLTTASALEKALIEFDSVGIEHVVREYERILQTLQQLEQQRWTLIANILGISHHQARLLTTSELLDRLPATQRETIRTCCQDLRKQLEHLQTANALNRLLALRGRNSINATLELIQERNLHALNTSC